MTIYRSLIGFFLLLCTGIAVAGGSVSWSHWAKANSIARHGDWLVVRQPNEWFCYLSQSYSGIHPNLSVKRKDLYLTGVNAKIVGGITYRVDDGKNKVLPKSSIEPFLIHFPYKLVKTLEIGHTLSVFLPIKGIPSQTYEFSLKGFTAAHEMLGSSECQKKAPDQS